MGLNVLAQQITTEQSTLASLAGVWGILVSGIFLLLLGTINLLSLQAIWRLFRGMRTGQLDEQELERALQNRGVLNRIIGPVARRVARPWKLYIFAIPFETRSAYCGAK